MKTKILYILFITFSAQQFYSQNNIASIESKLNQLAIEKEGLNEIVKIDVYGLNLYEFITSIADEHKLNVSVDSELNIEIISNFYDVKVKDVFLFLIKKYNIEIEFLKNIIIFNKKPKELKVAEPKKIKNIDVTYRKENDFLSINLKNDSLPRVAEKITDLSNKNIVLSPDIKNIKISAYIKNRPFDQVIEMMAQSNGLFLTKKEGGFYYLEKDTDLKNKTDKSSRILSSNRHSKKTTTSSQGSFEITLNPKGYLKIEAQNTDIADILIEAANKSNINYFIYDKPTGVSTSLFVDAISFDDLLMYLFKDKEYSYKIVDNYYFIGKHDSEGLESTELIQLENRTIESVKSAIPSTLTEGLDINEFIELNGLIVSGSHLKIEKLKTFISIIDKVVPLVQIEVIIVQYQKSHDIQTGIKAGLDRNERVTSGNLFPTADVALNSSSINGLIEAFNGLGIINIGKVTEQFYLNLKALENNSIIKLKSTPKIATLSGHEASVSIGETSYYFEQSNRLINSGLGNDILQSGQWKSTEASLSVTIKPFVSKDEYVTLDINVEKSAFLGRAGENAPPGKTTQQFTALVRVRNNEMILLGGLDELERENSGTGTPFLSRIPIIKWFFSSRTKKKGKSKLHVFIKPTITY